MLVECIWWKLSNVRHHKETRHASIARVDFNESWVGHRNNSVVHGFPWFAPLCGESVQESAAKSRRDYLRSQADLRDPRTRRTTQAGETWFSTANRRRGPCVPVRRRLRGT